ncbi:glycerophosphodiester phosphodiesterase family protein [Halomonas sp. WWR20]
MRLLIQDDSFIQDDSLTQDDISFDSSDFNLVAHRGASGYRPEHTLEAYRVAIEQGADTLEPDLVPTRDGVLVARHENLLNGTTDVAQHPEFADRYTTKTIDGNELSGWFTEDFTLAELKTLNARERIPEDRPGNTAYNDQFEIPTLEEVIALVKAVEAETGRQIAIIPELKHPTYFAEEGVLLDGSAIDIDTSQRLIDTLMANDFVDPQRVSVQSFEIENLLRLQNDIMPEVGIDLPLVQLISAGGTPWDVAYNFNADNPGANPEAYAELDLAIAEDTIYSDLWTEQGAQALSAYADIFGPSKDAILPKRDLGVPVDGNGNGIAQIDQILTGEVSALVENAHAAGIQVVPYTVRTDESFLSLHADGTVRTPVEEYVQLIETGIDGMFTDFPQDARQVIDQLDTRPAHHGWEPVVLEAARLLSESAWFRKVDAFLTGMDSDGSGTNGLNLEALKPLQRGLEAFKEALHDQESATGDAGIIVHDRNDIDQRDILVRDAEALNARQGTSGLDVALYAGGETLILPYNVENVRLRGTDDTELFANGLDNVIQGNAGDNLIHAGYGQDRIDAGTGNDVLHVPGAREDYTLALDAGGRAILTGVLGNSLTLTNVQSVAFSDGEFALFATDQADISGLYRAFLGRAPQQEERAAWSEASAQGASVDDIAQQLAGSAEFQARDDRLEDSEFIESLYLNVLGEPIDEAEAADWQAQLDDGTLERADLAREFVTSETYQLNHARIDPGHEWWAMG